MNNLNIPIYRAKVIKTGEYTEFKSFYKDDHGNYKAILYVVEVKVEGWAGLCDLPTYSKIDPSTLSIHFYDMMANDSNRLLPNGDKDLRIFASLREDGKGGDILDYMGKSGSRATTRYLSLVIHAHGKGTYINPSSFKLCTIVGVQE